MQLHRHAKHWWVKPKLKNSRIRIPLSYRELDPIINELPKTFNSKIGAFGHSRSWLYYNRLQSLDVGYITPVYDLHQIALRYKLSINAKRYFRKYILPEPFNIVRRRSLHAHHWSRFTLMALDLVLKDLESRGYHQFLKRFDEHILLLHNGVAYMEDYYAAQAGQKTIKVGDSFGVVWFND